MEDTLRVISATHRTDPRFFFFLSTSVQSRTFFFYDSIMGGRFVRRETEMNRGEIDFTISLETADEESRISV